MYGTQMVSINALRHAWYAAMATPVTNPQTATPIQKTVVCKCSLTIKHGNQPLDSATVKAAENAMTTRM